MSNGVGQESNTSMRPRKSCLAPPVRRSRVKLDMYFFNSRAMPLVVRNHYIRLPANAPS